MDIYEILIYFRKFYLLLSSDVLIWGNICQFSDEGQKSVQLQKCRVIPVSSRLGLPGSGSKVGPYYGSCFSST